MAKPSAQQTELFGPAPRVPSGFAYDEEIISLAEERALVALIADLPFRPFEFHGYLGNRRAVSFGWRYDYGARVLERAAPVPFAQRMGTQHPGARPAALFSDLP
jgi:hypothetical protein